MRRRALGDRNVTTAGLSGSPVRLPSHSEIRRGIGRPRTASKSGRSCSAADSIAQILPARRRRAPLPGQLPALPVLGRDVLAQVLGLPPDLVLHVPWNAEGGGVK